MYCMFLGLKYSMYSTGVKRCVLTFFNTHDYFEFASVVAGGGKGAGEKMDALPVELLCFVFLQMLLSMTS